jgi:exosortase/archaeosortase family protein
VKQRTSKLYKALFSAENRLDTFYVLAFCPLIWMAYYYVGWLPSLLIPVYGFLFLIMKKYELSLSAEAGSKERLLGLFIVVSSFLVYFVVSPLFPGAVFYGGINYAVYIIGLFLVFFERHILKEAFSSVFLIVAANSAPLVSRLVEPYFTPLLPYFTFLIVAIARAIGMDATIPPSGPSNVVILQTLKGTSPMQFVWECFGFESASVFATLLVIILLEEPGSAKTKIPWAVLGFVGTFLTNVVRLEFLLLVEYFSGGNVLARAEAHSFSGYILFFSWVILFLYLFSKREAMSGKIRSIRQRL